MSTSRTRNSLMKRLSDKSFRADFVGARVAAAIAAQVYNLRKRMGWTQKELADAAGMKQARISIIEQADYENFTLSTLKRLAAAFDVALIVEFVTFPRFLKWTESISPENLTPSAFTPAEVGLATGSDLPMFRPEDPKQPPDTWGAANVGQVLLSVGPTQPTLGENQRLKLGPTTEKPVEQGTFGGQP